MKRRTFVTLSSSTLAAAATRSRTRANSKPSPNELPNIACIGVGGKGWADANGAARHANIVAFADVESGRIKRRGGYHFAVETWPKAAAYTDWRKLLDEQHGKLDGVTVSTPDHMHAPVTMTALRYGLAAYTQKPLTSTVVEARRIAAAAAGAGVATQMGNQHHNGVPYRTLVQVIRGGALGRIERAHAWSNRPTWPQGIARPDTSARPETLDWDLWLGVAPERPFAPGVYHPFKWRGWLDFGTGALGDMGCHIIDPVVSALELGPPSTILAEAPQPAVETYPEWERIHYTFKGTRHTAADTFQLTWHDGGRKPDPVEAGLPAETQLPSQGTLFIGGKGIAVTPHGSQVLPTLYPEENFAGFQFPELASVDHYGQWVGAIVDPESATTSGFNYAGPLTETVLLGNIAARAPGQSLDWDPAALRFTNNTTANDLLHRQYRKGWEVEGL